MPWFPPYVPVGARRARVARVSDELRRNGVDVQPVHIEGRTIARSFWGRRWCHHLEWVRLFFVDGFFAYL